MVLVLMTNSSSGCARPRARRGVDGAGATFEQRRRAPTLQPIDGAGPAVGDGLIVAAAATWAHRSQAAIGLGRHRGSGNPPEARSARARRVIKFAARGEN